MFVGRTEPPDKHAAARDLECANGELHCRVDSKLVLFERVGETRRALRGCVESAWRDLVIQIAGCDRQKPCRPNRHVHLGNRCVHFTVVKTVEVDSDPFVYRSHQAEKTPGHKHRATFIAQIRRSRYVDFLGGTRRGEPHGTDHQNPSHQTAAKRCEPSHSHLHRRQYRRPSLFCEPQCEVRTVTRREMARTMPARDAAGTRQNRWFRSRPPPTGVCGCARRVRSHAPPIKARSS